MGNYNSVETLVEIPTYYDLRVSNPPKIEGTGNTIVEAAANLNKKCLKIGHLTMLNTPGRSDKLEDFNWYCDTFVIIRGNLCYSKIIKFYNVVLFEKRGDRYVAFINNYHYM